MTDKCKIYEKTIMGLSDDDLIDVLKNFQRIAKDLWLKGVEIGK